MPLPPPRGRSLLVADIWRERRARVHVHERRSDERERHDDARARPLRALSRGRVRALWLAAAALIALPVAFGRYLPLQDLPQHLAALRVLTCLHDPAFGFDADYVVPSGRVTYLLPYAAGVALAKVLGVRAVGKVLLAVNMFGTFLGLRALARAVRNDPRSALFCVPILVGPLFVIGLVPFLLGVMLLTWALAASARFAAEPTVARGLGLSALALAVALTHPIPFVVLVAGHASFVVAGARDRWRAAIPPLIPAGALFAYFLAATDAGAVARTITGTGGVGTRVPLGTAAVELFGWVADAFVDRSDDLIAALALLVALAATALAWHGGRVARAAWGIALLPLGCAAIYFGSEMSHGDTWPLAPRYAFLGAILVVPLLRIPPGRAGRGVVLAASLLAVSAVVNDAVHFAAFDREAAALDGVLARMRPRAHVASLVFDGSSKVVRFHPYLHAGAYYQVDRGGVVQFSFAGYDHWPVDFRDGRYPPPGGPAAPGWEWHPERVPASELVPYFDYVLVRGAGFSPPPGAFEKTYASGGYELWSAKAP